MCWWVRGAPVSRREQIGRVDSKLERHNQKVWVRTNQPRGGSKDTRQITSPKGNGCLVRRMSTVKLQIWGTLRGDPRRERQGFRANPQYHPWWHNSTCNPIMAHISTTNQPILASLLHQRSALLSVAFQNHQAPLNSKLRSWPNCNISALSYVQNLPDGFVCFPAWLFLDTRGTRHVSM